MNNTVIEFNKVHFSYTEIPILENVTFKIQRGDTVTIIGPNGGGKTTLLKLVLGLLKPDRGLIKINGFIPGKKTQRFGYIPQFIKYDSGFPITVSEIVLTGRLNRKIGFYSKTDKLKTTAVLEKTDLLSLSEKPFSELSGGQKQRVLIARALAGDPEILLLDEPTASIDVSAGESFIELLNKIKKSLTIILVSHDMSFVNDFSERVLCVNKIVNEHPADEINCGLIHSAYGQNISRVRHDIKLTNKTGSKE